VEQAGVMLNPLASWLVEVGPAEYLTAVQRAAGYLLLAGLVATALFGATLSRTRSLAQAVALTAFLGGSAFVLLSYFSQGVYFAPPARYGNTLVPAMAVLTAGALRTRGAITFVSVLAGAAVVITVYRLTAF
jgi:hypothetical protein